MRSDDSVLRLRKEFGESTVALYGFEGSWKGRAFYLQRQIKEWLGLDTIEFPPSSPMVMVDVAVLEERSLPSLAANLSPNVPAVVLCKDAIRKRTSYQGFLPIVIKFVSNP